MRSIPSNFSRRNFLKTTTAATILAGFPLTVRAQSSEAVNALNIPPQDVGRLEDGVRIYDLTMQNGLNRFFDGYETVTSGINGAYLGPTLRMQDGETVRLNVSNTLGEPSTLHWHGMHLPAKMDGGPHQIVKDGETWSPEFVIKQKAASLWYHPHLMGKTAEHVWRGMAGMIWINDAETEGLDLPVEYGVDDIPLVLQDRNFDRNAQMEYAPSRHNMMMGMTGATPLANGTVAPYFDVTTTRLRLRILNGSNASFYYLGLDNDQVFHQIASDGGLLEMPVEMTRLLLGPAERAEIVVDLTAGQVVNLMNYAGATAFSFVELRGADSMNGSADLPAKLTDIAWINPADAVKTRRFDMETTMGMGSMLGGNMHTINGVAMDPDVINETVKMGDVEIWEISNQSNMPHVFHMHDVQFQIVDRNGQPPADNEKARKDVVLLRRGEVVRIVMRFEDYADPDTPFMYHCHILEHEDAGMMGQFVVV